MMRSAWMALSVSLIFVCAVAAQQKKPAGKTTTKPADKPAAKSGADTAAKSNDSAKAVSAKDESQAPADKPAGDANSDDPAVIEFDKVFAEWKELLAKLQELRARYIATPRKGGLRTPIKKEYDDLVKAGDKLEPKVIEAAEAAYAAGGSTRPEIATFLSAQLKYNVEHDNYEPAVGIAEALIKNDYDNPRAYDLGGMAAFCTNDFDDAETWFKEAAKNSVLDSDGSRYRMHLKDYIELWEAEKALRDAEAKADDLPRVLLKTNKGDILVELFENEAPNTVANFISLVEKKFYDGTPFHRVLEHFMAQGGDPEGTGKGGPGYSIPDETDKPNFREHFRGSLSMANAGPNTGGSQFFLMFRPSGPAQGQFDLNGKHTVFGRVIDGMHILALIQRIDPDDPKGAKPDKIIEATVVRKRKHEYVPKKTGE